MIIYIYDYRSISRNPHIHIKFDFLSLVLNSNYLLYKRWVQDGVFINSYNNSSCWFVLLPLMCFWTTNYLVVFTYILYFCSNAHLLTWTQLVTHDYCLLMSSETDEVVVLFLWRIRCSKKTTWYFHGGGIEDALVTFLSGNRRTRWRRGGHPQN